jgi:hypothetical protein
MSMRFTLKRFFLKRFILKRFLVRHWPAYLLLLCFDLLISRSFLGERAIYWGDLALYFEPMYRLVKLRLHAGQTPLWNPYILCGQPLLGNPQMGVFYPSTLLLAFFSAWNMIRIACAIHLWLCGVWTYHFLTRWTTSRQPALAGALVFMGCPCLLGRLQFPPMIFAVAYLPFLLLCLDAVLDTRSRVAQVGLAVGVCLLLLASHPQTAYLALLCCGAYGFMRIRLIALSEPIIAIRRLNRRRQCVRLVAPLALGAGMAALQLLPALQVMLESPREQLTPGQANRFMLDPSHLLTLIWPHFLGNPATRDYWGPGNVWEPVLFIGWAPLLLIAYGASCGRGTGLNRFWLWQMGLCLWLALGVNAGLYVVAFYLLPGLGKFHDPARFLIPATFAAAVLTAAGLEALRRSQSWRHPRMCAGILVCIALPLIWVAPEWTPSARLADLTNVRPAAGWGSAAGRIYTPAHDQISRNYISAGYTDYGDAGPRSISALLDTWMPNLNMTHDVESASGYEPVPLRGPWALDGLTRIAYRRGEPNLDSLLRLMDVQTLALPGFVHLHYPPYTPIKTANLHYRAVVFLQNDHVNFCWLTRAVRHIDGEMRTGAFLTAPSFDPLKVAMISDDVRPDEPDLERVGTVAELPPDTVRDLHRQNDDSELTLTADAGSEPAYLVVSVAAFPGWQATVDGKSRTLHRTDEAMMGLFLPPGTHRVRIWYAPACYVVGLYISLVSLLIVAAVALQSGLRGFLIPAEQRLTS